MIKLIASDLDGTLLGPDFTCRPRTLSALESAAELGIDIVFVTGRPHRWLDPLRDQMQHSAYAICSNGAVLYHLGDDRVVSTCLTDMADVAAVHPVLSAEFPTACFTLETMDSVYIQGDYEYGPVLEGAHIIEGDFSDVLTQPDPVVKYLMRVEGADPETLYQRTLPLVEDHLALTIGINGVPLMEMAQKGMHKGRMLAEFAQERGIKPSEIVAFGDMPNDLEMLQWAGHSYAMASGSPRLIREIGQTCPGFEQDGVAQVIEKIVAEQRSVSPGL